MAEKENPVEETLELVPSSEKENGKSTLPLEWPEMVSEHASLDTVLKVAFNSILKEFYKSISDKFMDEMLTRAKNMLGDEVNRHINRISRGGDYPQEWDDLCGRLSYLEDETPSLDTVRETAADVATDAAYEAARDAIQEIDFERECDDLIEAKVDSAKDDLFYDLSRDLEKFVLDKLGKHNTDDGADLKRMSDDIAQLQRDKQTIVDSYNLLKTRVEGLENTTDLGRLKKQVDAVIEDINHITSTTEEASNMVRETSDALDRVGRHLSSAGDAARGC